MPDIETAEVHFITVHRSKDIHDCDDDITVAIGIFDGVDKVGCGPDRRRAMEDLFHNATGANEFKYEGGAAWKNINQPKKKKEKSHGQ